MRPYKAFVGVLGLGLLAVEVFWLLNMVALWQWFQPMPAGEQWAVVVIVGGLAGAMTWALWALFREANEARLRWTPTTGQVEGMRVIAPRVGQYMGHYYTIPGYTEWVWVRVGDRLYQAVDGDDDPTFQQGDRIAIEQATTHWFGRPRVRLPLLRYYDGNIVGRWPLRGPILGRPMGTWMARYRRWWAPYAS